MKTNLSISLRLTLWISSVFLFGFVIFGVAMRFDLAHSLSQGRDKTISTRAARLAQLLESSQFDSAPKLEAKFQALTDATPEGNLIQVYDRKRIRVHPAPGFAAADFPWPWQSITDGHSFTDVVYGNRRYRVFARQVRVSGESLLIVAAGQLEDNRFLLERFSTGLMWTTPALLVVSAVCGYLLSRRALAPVDRLTSSVRSISIGNLSRRLPIDNTGDELQRLAETCNDMLARLEGAVNRITRFTADASHELRSPISIIRTLAEYALRNSDLDPESADSLREIVAESEEASRLLEDMLTLARSDAGHAETVFETVDLAAIVSEACSRARPLAESRRHVLSITLGGHGSSIVLGDAPSLRRLFWILLDNAIRYTPAGGEIQVSLRRVGHASCVSVKDSGIGIPESSIPRIFDRFYRVDASRSHEEGTGLGLAIAKWIADVHRAELSVESSAHQGTTFEVVFQANPNVFANAGNLSNKESRFVT